MHAGMHAGVDAGGTTDCRRNHMCKTPHRFQYSISASMSPFLLLYRGWVCRCRRRFTTFIGPAGVGAGLRISALFDKVRMCFAVDGLELNFTPCPRWLVRHSGGHIEREENAKSRVSVRIRSIRRYLLQPQIRIMGYQALASRLTSEFFRKGAVQVDGVVSHTAVDLSSWIASGRFRKRSLSLRARRQAVDLSNRFRYLVQSVSFTKHKLDFVPCRWVDGFGLAV